MPRGGRLKSGLVIPQSVSSVKPPAFVCRVIVNGDGKLCGQQFTEDEHADYQRHVTKCARTHLPEIQGASLRERTPGFYGPEAGDPELEAWVRQHRTEIIEGRKSYYGKRKRHEVNRRARRGRR